MEIINHKNIKYAIIATRLIRKSIVGTHIKTSKENVDVNLFLLSHDSNQVAIFTIIKEIKLVLGLLEFFR